MEAPVTELQELQARTQLEDSMHIYKIHKGSSRALWYTLSRQNFSELPGDRDRCCIMRGHTIIATADSWTELKEFMDKPQRY